MRIRKIFSLMLAALLLLLMSPGQQIYAASQQAVLSFDGDSIKEIEAGEGYTINDGALTITADGIYRITGSSENGSIEVAKSLSDVTLILDNLTLANSQTAPVIVKKNANVSLVLEGENTVTDNEDPEKETTDADNFEGAAIKVKSGSVLNISGTGTLNAVGNTKNAIKGGEQSTLTVDGGVIKASAVSNGIGFDGSIIINDGKFDIKAGNDGLKSEPDEGDTKSSGIITINGGDFTIYADGDGIQAAEKLEINNGIFDIKTMDGYDSASFYKDTMSCSGLKASGNNDKDTEPTNELIINGGVFRLNTANDALHSEGYCDITGGTFDIYTGDDGVHADATLTLGSEGGDESSPEINIYASYEGLEGVVVNAYSGKYYVIAEDDGINSAGGSSNGQNDNNHDHFAPGGGRPGMGRFAPGGDMASSGDYSLNIYGGKYYIDCLADGLDSNGSMNLLGGDMTVLSMRGGGDNSPLDADGNTTINGATVFAAGSKGMGLNLSNTSQKTYEVSRLYDAGTVINILSSGNVVRSEKLVRNVSYILYSAPGLEDCSISTGLTENIPTATPTIKPTVMPTVTPNPTETVKPTATPTIKPTVMPTVTPNSTETVRPTATPTIKPTVMPTVTPNSTETVKPIATPTIKPTVMPTVTPNPTETVKLTASTAVSNKAVPVIITVSHAAAVKVSANRAGINDTLDLTSVKKGMFKADLSKVSSNTIVLYKSLTGNAIVTVMTKTKVDTGVTDIKTKNDNYVINNKGILTVKKPGDYLIDFNGKKVIVHAIDGLADQKKIELAAGSVFSVSVNAPVNINKLEGKIKSSVVTFNNVQIDENGKLVIIGKALGKGSAKLVYSYNGKKYKLNIKVK